MTRISVRTFSITLLSIVTLMLSAGCSQEAVKTESKNSDVRLQNKSTSPMAAAQENSTAPTSQAQCIKAEKLAETALSIVGGEAVLADDTIVQSTIMLDDICTAVIISDKYALTAAHCTANQAVRNLVFGLTSKNAPIRKIINIIEHPEAFSPSNEANDIAVVEFSGGLPTGFSSIEVVSSNEQLVKDMPIILSGFGITDTNSTDYGTLRKTKVSFMQSSKKSKILMFDSRNGHGACNGDSGGPAFVNSASGKLILVGITHGGSTGECGAELNIYADLRKHTDFLTPYAAKISTAQSLTPQITAPNNPTPTVVLAANIPASTPIIPAAIPVISPVTQKSPTKSEMKTMPNSDQMVRTSGDMVSASQKSNTASSINTTKMEAKLPPCQ